jgi:hypothetical protein
VLRGKRDNQIAMHRRQRARGHDQAPIGGAPECLDGALDLGGDRQGYEAFVSKKSCLAVHLEPCPPRRDHERSQYPDGYWD